MSARLDTIVRQKLLQRDAANILCEHFAQESIGAVGSMLVVKADRQVLCLDLQVSQRPPSKRRLEQHSRIRRKGWKVATVRTVVELRLALASLGAPMLVKAIEGAVLAPAAA